MSEIIRNSKQKVKVSDAKELSASVGVLELWMYVQGDSVARGPKLFSIKKLCY